MKKIIGHTAILLGLTISLSVAAAFIEEPVGYAHATLKGLKTIAVNIDPPRGSDYTELTRYGVSGEKLQEMITARLREAGFKVVSFNESLEDSSAALLDLRIRVDIPRGSLYAYDLKLSVKQKFPLTQETSSAYTSVRTWSDRQIGALQMSGHGLSPLYDYTRTLVDNFIRDYQAQN